MSVFLAASVSASVGPAVQLIWSVQPGSANVGSPFGHQPTLVTADASGNPSSIGLAATMTVTVSSVPAGLNGAPFTFNMGNGPDGSNGVAVLSGLEIDSAGGYSLLATSGNGTNAVFSPTNGISNCQLWLDASDLTSLVATNGANVSLWKDKSGANDNATNAVADGISNTPLLGTNADLASFAYGDAKVVSFFGTNRLNVDFSHITNGPFTIIALTELSPSETANNDFFMGTPFLNVAGGVDHVLHMGYRNAGPQYTFAFYADDLNVAWSGSGPQIASHVLSPGQKAIYLNGVLAGTGGSQFLGNVNPGNIGQGNGGSFHGDIAEIIVYNTNLTEVQRIGVENYLFNKWMGQLSSAATSTPFFVGNGSAVTGVHFVQQPTTTVAGVTISPSVTVEATGNGGAGVANIPIVLSIGSGSGTLNGTLTQVTDGTGVATFNDLNITNAGEKELTAVIGGAATNMSTSFTILPAVEAQLAVLTQPSASAIAGINFAAQPVVAVEDSFGNIVTNATDVIVVSETGAGDLSNSPTNGVAVSAVKGVATFSGLFITNAATTTLTFTSGSLPTLNSANIAVVPSAPHTVVIVQEPDTAAQVGVAIDTQPIISVLDSFGNIETNGTPVIATSSIGNLQGDTTESIASGQATFTSLTITNVGSVTLTFTSGTASAVSSAITVNAGPATTVVWTTQPGSGVAGAPLSQQPVLKTVDAGGNLSTLGLGATNLVVVHLVSGSGLVGTNLVYNIGTDGSNGVITFHNLEVDAAGNNDVLSADFLGSITDPTNGIPNCILWLDAYDSSTLMLSGTNLVEWVDKSGIENNGTNSGNYPITDVSPSLPVLGYGGQHAVKFLGNNWLDVDLTSLTGQPWTVFVVDVADPAAANGNSYFFGSSFNNVDATLHMGYRAANTFTFAQYADDLNWTAPANFAFGTPRQWTGRLDAVGNQEIFLNSVMRAQRGANAFPGTLIGGAVGVGNGGHYSGDLSEIIVYNRGLSDGERTQVEQYLDHKWLSNSRGLSAPFSVLGLTPTLKIAPTGTNVTITLTGASGHTYRILSTGDITTPAASWTPVGTTTLGTNGVYQLVQPASQPARFYRAVTP
ncbi:MAG TPA: hypothetical protein VH413_20225 [Verrucomicrobiae bacterium]|nr:hypothetical protein [Verrucomicrobiae bacterium]